MIFEFTWQKKDKYHQIQRKNRVTATSSKDAVAVFQREFGNETQIDILKMEEIKEDGDEECIVDT